MMLVLLAAMAAAMVAVSAVPAAAFEYEVISEEGLTYVELESDEANAYGARYDGDGFSVTQGRVGIGESYAFGSTDTEGSYSSSAGRVEAGGFGGGGLHLGRLLGRRCRYWWNRRVRLHG